MKQFWHLWRNDYLFNLSEETQMVLKGARKQAHDVSRVDDVVLIKENLPRGWWKVGIIHELIKGRDQMVCSAKVLVSTNCFLRRVLNLLYPIENASETTV